MYPVSQEYIQNNRSRKALNSQGIVVHATATPGATAANERSYFNSQYVGASAHYFVDWQEIIQTVPEGKQAWHAGPTANSRFLSVELCEPSGNDLAKFNEVWKRAVWLVADACIRHGWTNVENATFSHDEISNMYGETDHTDPVEYFAKYGKTFAQFKAEVQALVDKGLQDGTFEHPYSMKGASGIFDIVEHNGKQYNVEEKTGKVYASWL